VDDRAPASVIEEIRIAALAEIASRLFMLAPGNCHRNSVERMGYGAMEKYTKVVRSQSSHFVRSWPHFFRSQHPTGTATIEG
jgi:hypothetical protein